MAMKKKGGKNGMKHGSGVKKTYGSKGKKSRTMTPKGGSASHSGGVLSGGM